MIDIWAMNATGMEWKVASAFNEHVAGILVKALQDSDPSLTFTIDQ
jgi:hypothetical protein